MDPDEDAQAVLRAVADEYAGELLAKRGVHSVGVAYKEVRGESTGELCVSVAVERKLPASSLGEDDVIPSELSVGDTAVPTDVVERPPTGLVADNASYRPVIGGAFYTRGTVCGIAEDRTDSSPVFIGCNHCMCVRGDPLHASGENLYQPPAGGRIGRPKRLAPAWHNVIDVGYVVAADAAIASFSSELGIHPGLANVAEIGPGPIAGRVRGPVLREAVRIRGGATGHVVQARVTRIGLIYKIVWPPNTTVRVLNSFEVECAVGQTLGIPGDSGAPVYSAEEQDALGILCSTSYAAEAEADRRWGHANELDSVFDLLELRTYTWNTGCLSPPNVLSRFTPGALGRYVRGIRR
jgi:hypothetical protein